MFCFQALADNAFIPPLGYHLDKLDEVLDHCGKPVGVLCYLPDNCQGEDNIQDFLGMCGLPVMLTPWWPEKAGSILLTRSSACDPEIADKLEKYVAAGGKALVTSGFLEAAMDRGIQRMTSIRFTGRKIRGRRYRVENVGVPHAVDFPAGTEEIGVPVCEFRNNSTWAVAKVADTEESFGILLKDTYGKGQMWTLAVPDNFPDLYKLPGKVLTRIRREFPAGGVYLECKSGISLFPYDNDTLIIYPYATSQAQPATVYLHAAGKARELLMPVRKDFRSGGPMKSRNARLSGASKPSFRAAYCAADVMPISGSVIVPSRSKSRQIITLPLSPVRIRAPYRRRLRRRRAGFSYIRRIFCLSGRL